MWIRAVQVVEESQGIGGCLQSGLASCGVYREGVAQDGQRAGLGGGNYILVTDRPGEVAGRVVPVAIPVPIALCQRAGGDDQVLTGVYQADVHLKIGQ